MAIKIFKKVKNLINDLNKISTIRVSIDELINEVKNLKIQIKILIEKKISNDDYRSDARIQACQLYSFIKDDEIREQLSNHYEKMIKNQKKSFAKYCFHSHVQTELLINFYYNNKLTTPKEVEKILYCPIVAPHVQVSIHIHSSRTNKHCREKSY